ncbi:MAG: hypothetical protein R3D62_12600 [Xanthobacteraceae bacterium]
MARPAPIVLECMTVTQETRMPDAKPMPFRTLLSLLAIVGMLAGPLPAAAYDAARLPAAKMAAAAFATAARSSEKTGDVPRETDPAVRRLLEAVFDARDLDDGQAVPFQALPALSERMMTGVKVGIIYMLAGTGASDLTQLGSDPGGAEKVNLNVIKFAPEMGRFFDFQLRMQGAVVETVLERLATAKPEERSRPSFQSGLRDIRQGSARTVAGVIETLAVNGLSDEWRRERMPALGAIGPRLAKFLDADQKQQLKELALACAEVMNDAQVRDRLQSFADVISGG